jgi:hypothetical protein
VLGQIGLGEDGSVAAVLDNGSLLLGDRSALRVTSAPSNARGIDRDDDGYLWVVATGPAIAPIVDGQVGAAMPWTSATAADASVQAGLDVLDERNGGRSGSVWRAHNVLGDATLVAAQPALPYAVGARGWLVGDMPSDRGGISYSQVAFVPLGVTFP